MLETQLQALIVQNLHVLMSSYSFTGSYHWNLFCLSGEV